VRAREGDERVEVLLVLFEAREGASDDEAAHRMPQEAYPWSIVEL
jgi:hypothetical protein